MYIPILKNRKEEMSALVALQSVFGDNIVPYIEIIKDEYISRYKTDQNGEFVREPLKDKNGKTIRRRIKLEPTEADVCTLERIQEALNGKKAFVEMFRFHDSEYKNYDAKKIELSLRLSSDYNEYRKKTAAICNHDGLIPAVSIKPHFEISEYDLTTIIGELHSKTKSLAVRIEISVFDKYASLLETSLTESDYLFVDIREEPYLSQVPALMDMYDYSIAAKKIIFNSPRPANQRKKDYQQDGWEPSIDNSIARKYIDLNFDGFGDFAGLKDTLPEKIDYTPNSFAHTLIYQYDRNEFWSIRNNDSTEKMNGFREVKRKLEERKSYFDPTNDCIGFERIANLNPGNYGNWSGVILRRYIDQVGKNIK